MRTALALAATLSITALIGAPEPVRAQITSDPVGTCLTDNTSGRDRKELVRWIFVAISQHPDISGLSAVDDVAKQTASEQAGRLLTRLIAEDCATEIRALVRENGPNAISKPFEFLGMVAMQELMNHPNVGGFVGELDKYSDQQKIQQALTSD